jgi:hypothetical protein
MKEFKECYLASNDKGIIHLFDQRPTNMGGFWLDDRGDGTFIGYYNKSLKRFRYSPAYNITMPKIFEHKALDVELWEAKYLIHNNDLIIITR